MNLIFQKSKAARAKALRHRFFIRLTLFYQLVGELKNIKQKQKESKMLLDYTQSSTVD